MGPNRPDMVRRRAVLRETLDRFSTADPANKYELLAQANIERWRESAEKQSGGNQVYVVGGDWGEVTHAMTKAHGMLLRSVEYGKRVRSRRGLC